MPRPLCSLNRIFPITVLALLLMDVFSPIAPAGAGAAESTTHSSSQFTPQRAPLHHLYWHLLFYQNHLDRKAAVLDQQGRPKDAKSLRNHLQNDLHFTNEQFAVFRQAGLQLEEDLAAIQSKVRPIVHDDRQWIKLHGRSAGPPPGHAQVHQLQQERETVIRNAVAHLNQDLDSAAAAHLQTYVETEWASHVTVHKVHPPSHHAKELPSTKYHLEPRQQPEVQQ
jgi:hypothetical protein